MNKVGDNILSSVANWSFKGKTVLNFDQHIKKSIPLYEQGHNLICDISDFFVHNNSNIYDIGCATGILINKLAKHNNNKNANFIAIDIELDMINYAKQNTSNNNIQFINDDVMNTNLAPADMIICYYTVQFVPSAIRQELINKIYHSLNWGGALLLFEKMRAIDARFQDIFTTLYNDYKLRQGYSADDIIAKNRSLKGILEPFSTKGNIDLLTRAGFLDIITVQKYLAFEGLLAIK